MWGMALNLESSLCAPPLTTPRSHLDLLRAGAKYPQDD